MAHSTMKSTQFRETATCLLLLLLSSWTSTSSAFGLVRLGRQKTTLPLASQIASSSDDGEINNDSDSLTLQELAARLRQVRSQTRSEFANDPSSPEAISAQLDLCDQLLSTRFRNLALSRCQAQPSSIHGMGLFATRPIAANELITLYPGDALLAWGDEYGGKPGPDGCPLQAMYGPHILEQEHSAPEFFLTQPNARDFEVVTGKRRSIVGDPSRTTDHAYLGHLANDAACLVGNNNVGAYEQTSSEGENAAHLTLEGCQFVTIATRDIEKSEEILVSYGEGYWKGRGTKNSTSSVDQTEKQQQKKKKNKADKSSRGFGKT